MMANHLFNKGASSRKLKYQTKMVGILKSNLKDYNPEDIKYSVIRWKKQVVLQHRKIIIYVRIWLCKCERCITW